MKSGRVGRALKPGEDTYIVFDHGNTAHYDRLTQVSVTYNRSLRTLHRALEEGCEFAPGCTIDLEVGWKVEDTNRRIRKTYGKRKQ